MQILLPTRNNLALQPINPFLSQLVSQCLFGGGRLYEGLIKCSLLRHLTDYWCQTAFGPPLPLACREKAAVLWAPVFGCTVEKVDH